MNRQADSQELPCTTSAVRFGFEKKLSRYAMAAGAVLAVPMTAGATGTFYSGPVDETVSNGQALYFSLDGSGADFALGTYAYSYPYNYGAYSYLDSATAGAGITSPLHPLAPGTTISSGSSFGTGGSLNDEYVYYQAYTYYYPCGKYTCSGTGYNPVQTSYGAWPNDGNPYFVGLDFTRSGQTYYGWAEIGSSVSDFGSQAELFDYGYNSNPGGSIAAGQLPTPVPEPPTMVFFALGAVGVLALSRRRRAISDPI
jgi:hypothetical protein